MTEKPYIVNIDETDEEGNFHCPNCDQLISPDDFSGENYIMGIKYYINGASQSYLIHCLKCGAKIVLTFVEVEEE